MYLILVEGNPDTKEGMKGITKEEINEEIIVEVSEDRKPRATDMKILKIKSFSYTSSTCHNPRMKRT